MALIIQYYCVRVNVYRCVLEWTTWYIRLGNVCIQTCYNTIILYLLHITPIFPENKLCIWRHTLFTIICLDFSWYKNKQIYICFIVNYFAIFLNVVGNTEHDGRHSTLL
jgi:hypothetical protein